MEFQQGFNSETFLCCKVASLLSVVNYPSNFFTSGYPLGKFNGILKNIHQWVDDTVIVSMIFDMTKHKMKNKKSW